MSDIFISYAREDKVQVELLARDLTARGWSVFWDHNIPPGGTWRSVIGAELETARAVIVAWSRAGVESEFVTIEAEEGRSRGILIPVFLEEAKPPLGFGNIHGAPLIDWKGDTENIGYQELVRVLEDMLEINAGTVGNTGPTARLETSAPEDPISTTAPSSGPGPTPTELLWGAVAAVFLASMLFAGWQWYKGEQTAQPIQTQPEMNTNNRAQEPGDEFYNRVLEIEKSLGDETSCDWLKQTPFIPGVMVRPLDIDEGDRIDVSKITLTGQHLDAVDKVDPNIREKIREQVEKYRKSRSKRTGNADEPAKTMGTDNKVSMTLGELQRAADIVTKIYRDEGYFLAKAILPIQYVENAEVYIVLIMGILTEGGIVIEGLKEEEGSIALTQAKAAFRPILNRPFTMNQFVVVFSDFLSYPGWSRDAAGFPVLQSAYGTLEPDPEIAMGRTSMVYKVQNGSIKTDKQVGKNKLNENALETLAWLRTSKLKLIATIGDAITLPVTQWEDDESDNFETDSKKNSFAYDFTHLALSLPDNPVRKACKQRALSKYVDEYMNSEFPAK